MMGSEGFEPSKAEPTDLQSAPFDRSGNSPERLRSYHATVMMSTRVLISVCYTAGIEAPEYLPQVNAMARPAAPVCPMEAPLTFRPMKWLLLPPQATTAGAIAGLKIWTANARIEELEEKPLYRPLIRRNRCVVRFLWFFEWRNAGTVKEKYRVYLPDKEPLLIPGLWHRTTVDGVAVESFTLCTMEAQGVMRYVHNGALRQPVVVGRSAAAAWLSEGLPFSEAREAVIREERSREFITDPLVTE